MFVRYEPHVNIAVIDLLTVLNLFLSLLTKVYLFHLLFYGSISFPPSFIYLACLPFCFVLVCCWWFCLFAFFVCFLSKTVIVIFVTRVSLIYRTHNHTLFILTQCVWCLKAFIYLIWNILDISSNHSLSS